MTYSYDRTSGLTNRKVVHQEVHWLPPGEYDFRVEHTEAMPDRLWVLFQETSDQHKPSLPFRPVGNHNAFFESWGDDWMYRGGKITLQGRTDPTGFWVLVEWLG